MNIQLCCILVVSLAYVFILLVCMCLNKDDYTKNENTLSYFVKCIS